MRAVIYSRISKDEQSKYSLEEQTVRCRSFLESEGHEVVDVFVDDGYSSKTMKRPELQRMLAAIAHKSFDIICVWNSDRLTRTTLDGLLMVITMFRPAGIDFASVTEDIDTSTPDGMMMFTIRLSMAQREREKIAERASMGQQARARTGKRNSSAKPYGYEVGEDLVLTILEDEAIVVKQIFEWFIEGYGKTKICNILNKTKKIAPPRGGQYWLEPTIKAIIANPTFYGANHYKPKNGARIIVENMHEAIVSKDTWIHANEIMRRKKENLMNRSSYEFPFSTVVKCGLCGRSYHGAMKSVGKLKEKYPKIVEKEYYRCAGYYRQNGCDAASIMEYKLVRLLFDTIDFAIEPFDQNEPIDKPSPSITKERKRLTKEISKSKESLVKLAKAMSSGNLDYDIYTKLRTEEKERVDNLESLLLELPSEDVTPTSKKLGEVAQEIRDLKKDWNSWSRMKRKQMIQKIFKRVVINKINGEWRVEEIEMNA